MKKVMLVMSMLAIMVLSLGAFAEQDSVEVDLSGGRYTLWVDGVEQEGYKTQLYTAIGAATNLGLTCNCTVTIKAFDIEVNVKRTPVENEPPVPLSDLGGVLRYIVSYKMVGTDELNVVMLPQGETSLVITDFAKGQWEFQTAVINLEGEMSAQSKPFYVEIS